MLQRGLLLVALLAALGLSTPARLCAQIVRPLAQLDDVKIEEHLNSPLPLDLDFVNDAGKPIKLKQLFDGKRPVVLSLNYSNCPMLCGMKLRGMVDALAETSLQPGQDYQIVSVSIDPLETTARVRLSKQEYISRFGRGNGSGWTFLTGRESQIRALADAVGFKYRYIPDRHEYAHAAVFMICTPEGVMSRYLYGVRFEPKTVQFSLIEAAQGRIGTTFDKVLLFCFHYDATSGNYAPAVISLMKIGGVVTVVAVAVFLIPWRRKLRRPPTPLEFAVQPPVSEPQI